MRIFLSLSLFLPLVIFLTPSVWAREGIQVPSYEAYVGKRRLIGLGGANWAAYSSIENAIASCGGVEVDAGDYNQFYKEQRLKRRADKAIGQYGLISCPPSNGSSGSNIPFGRGNFCPAGTSAEFRDPTDYNTAYAKKISCWVYQEKDDECTRGNPVDVFTGRKLEDIVDYRGNGSFPLELRRYYDSSIFSFATSALQPGIGNWTHSYSTSLWSKDGRIGVIRPDQSTLYFHLDDTGAISSSSSRSAKYTLEKSVDGYTLKSNNGILEEFDSQGRLAQRTKDGISHVVNYADNINQIDNVVHSDGYELSFSYNDSGQMESVDLFGDVVVSYTYDSTVAAGNLASVSSVSGRKYLYEYSENGFGGSLLSKATDPDTGWEMEYVYDTDHTGTSRVVLETRVFDGRQYAFNYSSDYLGGEFVPFTEFTNELGAKTKYRYEYVGLKPRITKVEGAATEFCPARASEKTYDASGYVSAKVDWEGNRTTYDRDARGRISSKTEAEGTPLARTITTTWHTQWSKPVQVVEPGRQTDITYDASGNLSTRVVTDTASGLSRIWTYSYSLTGKILSVDGPRTDVADVITFTYYDCNVGGNCGQRHTATNALGHVTTFNDYDAHGNPLSITDGNGVVTTLTYDSSQRLLTSTTGGSMKSYTYDVAGNIQRVTSPDGSYLQYTWDAVSRLVALEDALGNRMEWDLDAADNRTATRYKDAAGTLHLNQAQQYDELSRLIKTIYAVSGEASYGYDKNGNQTSTVEPGGATTGSAYDALNRLISNTDANQGVTAYGNDSQGNLTTLTDPVGNVTTYTYNGFGDVLQLSSPDTGITTYTVDAAGNRTSETDARGVTVNNQYDALNRLTGKSYPDSTLDVNYTYDQGLNSIGRLSSVMDSTGSSAYSYDARGNITEQRSTIDGVLYTTGYIYDAANKLSRTTYTSGRTLDYSYDTAGRLASITHTGGGTSETLISNIQYLPFGPMTGYTLGNGVARAVEYDLDYRIGRIADGSILDRNYAYSAANNISGITDALAPANSQLFGYDDLNRLTNASGGYGSHGYAYDEVGNRQSFTDDQGSATYSYSPSSNRLMSVAGVDRTRDAVGNLTITNGNTFSYSDQSRLSGVNGLAGTIEYGHNAHGQRVSKTANGVTRHYLFDRLGQLIGERNSDGAESVEYAYLNGQPLAMWRDTSDGGTGGGTGTGGELAAGEGDSGTLGLKEWKHYTLAPSANDRSATITFSGLTDDGDLYLRLGAQADSETYDCKSDNGSTSTESCTLAVPANATLHFAIHGYAATDYVLSTSATDTGGSTGGGTGTGGELAAGEGDSGTLGLKEWKHYTLAPSANDRSATITFSGLTDDGDLYLRLGAQADSETYDCKSDNGSTSTESCTLAVPANATLHFAIHGYAATDYVLSTSATDTGGSTSTGGELALGQSESGSAGLKEWHHYTLSPTTAVRTVMVALSGLTDDGDLYLRLGSQNDGTTFDCRSDNGSTNEESCTLNVPANATLHIGVHGWAATDYVITVGGQ